MVSSWHNLTEAEKVEVRARNKKRWLLKQRGQGGYVDAAEMQARIRKLHDVHEIGFQRIADKTGVDLANIKWHYAGRSTARPDKPLTTCQWRVHNAVMTTPFGPADRKIQIRSTGTQRRLQALVAAGYSQKWLAEHTGRALEHLNNFMVKNRVEVSAEHAAVVEQIYRKYIDMDPAEAGVSQRGMIYARIVAKKRSYPPGVCWDDDTIDDPEAVPEWTGACGTEEGYRVHIRETLEGNYLPPCPACKAVVEVQLPGARGACGEVPFDFDHQRFDQALAERGINPRQLAIKMRRDPREADRFYRWRKGERNPANRAEVHLVAAALELEPSELMTDRPVEAKRNAIGNGNFNPYVFKAVIEMAAWSQSKAANVVGVAHTTISNWIRGASVPKSKEVLQPLADVLGFDVEVFFT